MKHTTTLLGNLLSPLERSEFDKAVLKHSGDKGTRTLTTFNLFKTLVYGQITQAFSVREIESTLQVNARKLYHCGMVPVKRSTLCDALEKRSHQIFEDVFTALAAKAQFQTSLKNKRFKNPLKIIDATTIDLCLNRFDWAKFRKTKGAVKLHLKLDGDHLFPEQACLTTGDIHEVNRMTVLCQAPGTINTFDRGYIDYKRLYQIELSGSFFVTRMKNNCQHRTMKVLFNSQTGELRSDKIIKLVSIKGQTGYPQKLRKIHSYDSEYKKHYIFLTNNFDLSAQEIADVYKTRWQIELFFKWIKQNLKIRTFWGTSKNAVFTQIWIALIVYLLLWLHKLNGVVLVSTQRLIQAMKSTLLNRTTISDLFRPPPLFEPVVSLQLLLEGL